ncbi:MAG: magnesium chelatase [Gemmatimonadales bacterium]
MSAERPATLGELRRSAWGKPPLLHRSVRDEVRVNLLRALAAGEPLFPGIHGYDDTIIPELVHALLARQDFILLGLRGQAKSRILRGLTRFLDEWLPIVAGSEVNDDPFAPISKYARERITAEGDATPIGWLDRDDRYVEKLATPDVTIADLIGDLDPIRAARGGHVLSDELTMHFGLLPRANRGVFAINELPDLAGKIQVGLFNIMQEGDVQLKGYPVRLKLDVLLCFTANPEDYTARGKIITPLKDRIGAEITTHYPRDIELGMAITEQEAWTARNGGSAPGDVAPPVRIPPVVREVVERVAFEARGDKRVDRRSGVSQRLPISTLENVVSSAERRAVAHREREAVPRISDVYAALPSITGKLELEYEGELQGSGTIAKDLIRRAALRTLLERLRDEEDERLDRIVAWFDAGAALKVAGDEQAAAAVKAFAVVPGLLDLVHDLDFAPRHDPAAEVAGCELVLEALAGQKRITRSEEYGWGAARPPRPGPPNPRRPPTT